MRKISTLMVSVLCMMMPVGAEAQVPTAFVSKGATDIQAQPHSVTQTNSGAQLAAIDPMVRSITMDNGLPSNAVHHIHQLYCNDNKSLLIASDDGLVQYDIQNRIWHMLSEVNNPSRSTSERFVYGIADDNEGGIWVTTYYGGVSAKSSRSSRLPLISRKILRVTYGLLLREAACGAWTRIMPGNSINM